MSEISVQIKPILKCEKIKKIIWKIVRLLDYDYDVFPLSQLD